MKYHAGILWGMPQWENQREVLILALTPGVPLEWIYKALGLEWRRRRRLRAMLAWSQSTDYPHLGLENAASVREGDGWMMLQVVCPGYSGPAPLASQLELRNSARSDTENAKLLGVDRKKVWRWRSNPVFDPLSGARMIPNRGIRVT